MPSKIRKINFLKKLYFIHFLHIIKANFSIKNDIIPSLELLLKLKFYNFIHLKNHTDFIKG